MVGPAVIPNISDIEIKYEDLGPVVTLNPEKVTSRRLDPSFFDNVNINRPFSIDNTAYENDNPDLPVILFLRDSYTFINYTEKYIPQHFGRSIFIHNRNTKHFEEYIDYFKPDIVVLESGERGLRIFADHVNDMPELP